MYTLLFSYVNLPDPRPSLTRTPAIPEKSSGLNPSQYVKQWRLSSKADKTTVRTVTGGARARLRISQETTSPDKHAQMLKMISALEELHKTFNSTLSSRITILPRGTGSVVDIVLCKSRWSESQQMVYQCMSSLVLACQVSLSLSWRHDPRSSEVFCVSCYSKWQKFSKKKQNGKFL